MDSKGTSCLKKENNEVYAEPGSLVQLHTSTMKVKEELDEQVNQQVLTVFPMLGVLAVWSCLITLSVSSRSTKDCNA
ncbi:uncharacterized protein LOC126442680 isoform X2 [Schistocerca serialis cubense]|uniref:uncharacterized protein LOC126442680 isoform X2 n=1 Tax=Schistocerca serialis cubense TaxID=2023355 RepID=UPI00214E0E2F|nr:uncharacterized protein LOC126442680 isoform X2 [Schistocerca serialis cubense]